MEKISIGKLRVCVVADWKRRYRGCFWPEVLKSLDKIVATDVTVCNLADRILRAEDPPKLPEYFLNDCDVLIINWDAVNGDPDYGSNLSLQWFEARRPELLIWVENGGVLIIEGQAAMSIPVQKSYDALLGRSGLTVCGPEDELGPRLQKERHGDECQTTSLARKSQLFRNLTTLSSKKVHRQFDEMFPSQKNKHAITSVLKQFDWNSLYRGWFRWNLLRKKRLPWVSLIRTTGRKKNHSTMMVAKHGGGAIFVSTMYLASSKQDSLIEALLRAHKNVSNLPSPRKYNLCLLRYFTEYVVPILAGLGAVFIVAGKLKHDSKLNPVWEVVVYLLLMIVVAFIFWTARYIASKVKKCIKEIIGY